MEEQLKKKEVLWTAQFTAIVIAFVATQFSQSMVQSTFSMHINELGATATLVGTITSIFALVGMFMRIIFGPLMKTYSRKILAIVSAVIQIGAYLGYAFTPTVMGTAVVRIIQGVGHCMSAGVFLALASESIPKSRMTEGIGVFTAVPMIFTAWANPLMLLIVDRVGWTTAYITATALMVVAMIITFFIKYEDPNKGMEKPKLEIKLVNIVGKGTLVPILLLFVGKAATTGYAYYQIYAKAVNPDLAASIGLTTTVIMWLTVISRPFISKMADKIGTAPMLIVCMIGAMICFVTYSYSTTLMGFMIGAVFFGLFAQHPEVLLKALFVKYLPDNMRGVASNAAMFAVDASSFVAPIVSGYLVDMLGGDQLCYGLGYRYWCVLGVVFIIMCVAFNKNIRSHEKAFLENENNNM